MLYQITGGDVLNKFEFSTTTEGLLKLKNAIDVDKPTADPALYFITVQVTLAFLRVVVAVEGFVQDTKHWHFCVLLSQ